MYKLLLENKKGGKCAFVLEKPIFCYPAVINFAAPILYIYTIYGIFRMFFTCLTYTEPEFGSFSSPRNVSGTLVLICIDLY